MIPLVLHTLLFLCPVATHGYPGEASPSDDEEPEQEPFRELPRVLSLSGDSLSVEEACIPFIGVTLGGPCQDLTRMRLRSSEHSSDPRCVPGLKEGVPAGGIRPFGSPFEPDAARTLVTICPMGAEDPPKQPHSSWSGVGDHFSAKAWKETVWDEYLTQPEILIPIGLGASAAIISHWDKTLQKQWNGLLGNHRSYSDIGQYTLIGSTLLLGLLAPGEGRNAWDELWTIGEGYGAAALSVAVLKEAVQRPRPGGGGIGTHSFPSGHSSAAFTSAALIQENSGWLAGAPAAGLAAFTAFERVEEGHHYPSDVLAGAAIGVLSASIFDRLHWGSGPAGPGIARNPPEVRMSFSDGLRGFDLELVFKF